MNFSEWLEQTEKLNPELKNIVSRLRPFITESGFNYEKFENRLTAGINAYDNPDWVYRAISHAQSKKNNS
jgi:hypothetical protein